MDPNPPRPTWSRVGLLALLTMVSGMGLAARRCWQPHHDDRDSVAKATSRAPGSTSARPPPGSSSRADHLRLDLSKLRAQIAREAAAEDRRASTRERQTVMADLPTRFQRAMAADERRYTSAELSQIQALYRAGVEGRDTPEGEAALHQLIDQYPDSNRAGCAAMNLAAGYLNHGDPEFAEPLLEHVIERRSAAVFKTGERVLPKALFNYGMMKYDQGDADAAHAAWRRVLSEFPDELDAEGVPYGILARKALELQI